MEKTEKKNRFVSKFIASALGVVALVLVVTLCIPSTRDSLRSHIMNPSRKVLSVASGNLLNDGNFVKVVKYQTLEGILIEILSSDKDGSRSLIDRIKILGEHDGYFDFYGEASQLAIVDLDNDGKMELVAPSFDSDLVAHLNIYTYNSVTRRFEPLQK